MMQGFVSKHSIVREIWGKSDTILFIFAGSAAEFALNKAVDWLFFTGRLPADPLGRLFSTVTYARKIVFSETGYAYQVIDKMAEIHQHVEKARGMSIPEWAYRDVLYMLIDYSIRAYELLQRKLTIEEKKEVFDVFRRVGVRMGVKNIPLTFEEWLHARKEHLENDLGKSHYTEELFKQYKVHLGRIRYEILLAAQSILVPDRVRKLLGLQPSLFMKILVTLYKGAGALRLDWYIKKLILPTKYVSEVKALDTA